VGPRPLGCGLRGRIAYDVRLELLPRRALDRVIDFRNEHGPGWQRAADGYELLQAETATQGRERQAYDVVLVDEYQDTDPAQEALLHAPPEKSKDWPEHTVDAEVAARLPK